MSAISSEAQGNGLVKNLAHNHCLTQFLPVHVAQLLKCFLLFLYSGFFGQNLLAVHSMFCGAFALGGNRAFRFIVVEPGHRLGCLCRLFSLNRFYRTRLGCRLLGLFQALKISLPFLFGVGNFDLTCGL